MENQTFPQTKIEALAMLYVTKKVSPENTPEELARMYDDALTRIKAEIKRINNEKLKQKQKINL